MLESDKRSCDFRREHIHCGILALWKHDHELLEDAAIELSVDLEIFAAELDSDVSRQHLLADQVSLLRAWLEAQSYPDWEPGPESVLNDLTEEELYLALAKYQLDLSGMTAQGPSTAADELEHRNAALTDSERALAHAERLTFAIRSSRFH